MDDPNTSHWDDGCCKPVKQQHVLEKSLTVSMAASTGSGAFGPEWDATTPDFLFFVRCGNKCFPAVRSPVLCVRWCRSFLQIKLNSNQESTLLHPPACSPSLHLFPFMKADTSQLGHTKTAGVSEGLTQPKTPTDRQTDLYLSFLPYTGITSYTFVSLGRYGDVVCSSSHWKMGLKLLMALSLIIIMDWSAHVPGW